jgi:hypothetical protein
MVAIRFRIDSLSTLPEEYACKIRPRLNLKKRLKGVSGRFVLIDDDDLFFGAMEALDIIAKSVNEEERQWTMQRNGDGNYGEAHHFI